MTGLRMRALERADFPQLRVWLAQPHVARWWNHDSSAAGVEADFGPAVDGLDPTGIFVVAHDGMPIGLMQQYTFADNPGYLVELEPLVAVPAEAFSIDYFIGEPGALRRGLGTAMIRATLEGIWRGHPGAPAVVVPVNMSNAASWRALRSAGLRQVARGPLAPDNPIDDRDHGVWWIDRPGASERPV